jgi:hypothetical protein
MVATWANTSSGLAKPHRVGDCRGPSGCRMRANTLAVGELARAAIATYVGTEHRIERCDVGVFGAPHEGYARVRRDHRVSWCHARHTVAIRTTVRRQHQFRDEVRHGSGIYPWGPTG